MPQPGDQPNPWSREGQFPSQNQPDYAPPEADPQIPVYPPASGPDPLPQFDSAPAPKPPGSGYPAPYTSHPTGYFPPPAPYVPPPPPMRRTGLWVALGALTAVLVGLAMWGVIADNRTHPVGSPGSGADKVSSVSTKVVTATDKKSQVTVPVSWAEAPSRFKITGVSIQLGDLRREQYIVVTTVDMTDFTDFTAFVEASVGGVRDRVEGAQISPQRNLYVGGLNGVGYEITGTSAGIRAIFWYTLIEGKRGFYQVITWTLPSHKAEAEPVILKVIDSFRELPAG